MIQTSYKYAAEKLAAARRALMAPHPDGEADSFGHAFLECDFGIRDVQLDKLDDNARTLIATIRRLMDTTGIDDPQDRGTWFLKAERLNVDDKCQFSRAIDELADWFHERFMGR